MHRLVNLFSQFRSTRETSACLATTKETLSFSSGYPVPRNMATAAHYISNYSSSISKTIMRRKRNAFFYVLSSRVKVALRSLERSNRLLVITDACSVLGEEWVKSVLNIVGWAESLDGCLMPLVAVQPRYCLPHATRIALIFENVPPRDQHFTTPPLMLPPSFLHSLGLSINLIFCALSRFPRSAVLQSWHQDTPTYAAK